MEMKNNVHTISLDAVDVNLLPILQKNSSNGTARQCSTSNLESRRNEHYRNDGVIESVTCHICDMDVPRDYFKEHKNCFRHKFNKKVAETALKRLQLHVKQDDINENNERDPSKHFCNHCSMIIDSKDETTHRQTTRHRDSIFFERFLNDFLKFYTNDDNEIDDDNTLTILNSSERDKILSQKSAEDNDKCKNDDKSKSMNDDLNNDENEIVEDTNAIAISVNESNLVNESNALNESNPENESNALNESNPENEGFCEVDKDAIVENNDKNVKNHLNKYFCYICNVQVTNSPFNIRQHNQGRSHRLRAQIYSHRW